VCKGFSQQSSGKATVAEQPPRFDPLGVLATLDRHRVAYIVIGGFGRVVRGTEEITRGLDIVPSAKPDNLQKLEEALDELGARKEDGKKITEADLNQEVVELITDRGELKIVGEPVGTSGYEDLRRAATREPLGRGLRPPVASTDDLGRMLAAWDREEDRAKLRQLRELADLERGLGLEL
jgi:hypothetical protein